MHVNKLGWISIYVATNRCWNNYLPKCNTQQVNEDRNTRASM